MNSKKLYVFLIGSLLSILLLLTDSAFMPTEESSSTLKTSINEVSFEKDGEPKLYCCNFKITKDDIAINSHLYLNKFTSYAYESNLFRPPIFI